MVRRVTSVKTNKRIIKDDYTYKGKKGQSDLINSKYTGTVAKYSNYRHAYYTKINLRLPVFGDNEIEFKVDTGSPYTIISIPKLLGITEEMYQKDKKRIKDIFKSIKPLFKSKLIKKNTISNWAKCGTKLFSGRKF